MFMCAYVHVCVYVCVWLCVFMCALSVCSSVYVTPAEAAGYPVTLISRCYSWNSPLLPPCLEAMAIEAQPALFNMEIATMADVISLLAQMGL